MSNLIVYSKPNCPQCDFTKKLLSEKGHQYETIDVTLDEDGLNAVRGLGYQQLPVVVYMDKHWSGFRPDLIQAI